MADYGMQQTLTSRYGIKATELPAWIIVLSTEILRTSAGKSADPQHLSRCPENGSKNGQYVYTVRIHIRGNYIVGRYATDIEAAIAYNKAIDILHSKGVTSNFTPTMWKPSLPAVMPRSFYARHCTGNPEL